MSRLITTSLPNSQYIEFLQFCKKNKMTKSNVAHKAIIKYCKIKSKKISSKSIDEELDGLLKDDKT